MKKIFLFFVLTLFSFVTFSQITWEGSVSNDWQTAGNWDLNLVPTSVDNVVIANAGIPPVIDDGSTVAVCNNLTINSGAVLTIASNGRLTVNGTVTNNAGAAGFVVKSDATGDGSLIANNVFAVTIERYMKGGVNNFFSIPISGVSSSSFSEGYLFYYNESASDYWIGTVNYTEDSDGWLSYSGILTQDIGYAYSHLNGITKTFVGNILYEASPSNITLPYTAHSGNIPDPPFSSYSDFDGWNFVGNKYPCTLDWDNVSNTKTNINNIIYFYDGTNDRYAYYNGNTHLGSNGGTNYIPPQQGFFVKSLVGGGSINFSKNARLHNDQTFWKNKDNKNKDIDNIVRIQADANSNTEETIIGFLPDASSGEDIYDTYRIPGSNPDNPEIFSVVDGITNGFVHNFLPIPDSLISIPLGLHVSLNSEVTLTFTEFLLPVADYVYLEDTYSKSYISVHLGSTYTFTQTIDGLVEDRFIFHVGVNSAPTQLAIIDNQSVDENQEFFLDVSNVFEDYDILDEITFSSKLSDGNDLPLWLNFEPSTQTYSGTPTNNDIGTITITLFAVDSYGDSSSVDFDLIVNQGFDIFDNESTIQIFPNPTSGQFSIISEVEQVKQLSITDMLGKKIISNSLNSSKLNVDISEYPSGIYFVKLTLFSDEQVVKILVKK